MQYIHIYTKYHVYYLFHIISCDFGFERNNVLFISLLFANFGCFGFSAPLRKPAAFGLESKPVGGSNHGDVHQNAEENRLSTTKWTQIHEL